MNKNIFENLDSKDINLTLRKQIKHLKKLLKTSEIQLRQRETENKNLYKYADFHCNRANENYDKYFKLGEEVHFLTTDYNRLVEKCNTLNEFNKQLNSTNQRIILNNDIFLALFKTSPNLDKTLNTTEMLSNLGTN